MPATQRSLSHERPRVAFKAERDRVPANGVLDATATTLVEELRRLSWRGHDELERARAAFAAAIEIFGRIRATVPAGERAQYFGRTRLPSPWHARRMLKQAA